MAAERSIGSLAKPMTYLTALGIPDTYRLNTWLDDQPLTINVPAAAVPSPRNDSKTFSGRVMLVDALARSINVPTVNLGMAVGLDAVADTFVRLGAPAKISRKSRNAARRGKPDTIAGLSAVPDHRQRR